MARLPTGARSLLSEKSVHLRLEDDRKFTLVQEEP